MLTPILAIILRGTVFIKEFICVLLSAIHYRKNSNQRYLVAYELDMIEYLWFKILSGLV